VKIAVSMELITNQKSMAGNGDIGKVTAKSTQKHTFTKIRRHNLIREKEHCGESWDPEHLKHCRVKEAKYRKCETLGHYVKICKKKQYRSVNEVHNH